MGEPGNQDGCHHPDQPRPPRRQGERERAAATGRHDRRGGGPEVKEPAMPDPRFGPSSPLAPPLYAASVYTLPDLDALDDIYEGRSAGYIYARDAHPNAHHLADQLTKLESAKWGIV